MLGRKANRITNLLNLPSLLRSARLMRLKADSRYTIADYIEGQAARHADRTFILFEERTISYREFNAMANRVAHWALSVGLRAGDTVGFMMTNRAEYVPVWSGLAKVGVRAALVNTNLKGQSVLYALEGAGATRLLVGAECTENLAGIADLSDIAVHLIPEDGADAIAFPGADDIGVALSRQPESNPDAQHRAEVRTGDSAFYIYTSGTTGLPKAAKFNHQKLALFGMLGPLLGLRKGQVVYSTLPLYHGSGGVGAVMMAMGSGGAVAIARKFSASTFWDDVRRFDATAFMYIGELCRFLLSRPASADDGRHNLRFMFGNGLRADIWTAFQDRFCVPRIVEAYGATESNIGAINLSGKVGSVGKVIGGATLLLRYDIDKDALVLDENGQYVQCADGEVGELVSRIPRDPNALRGQFQGYTSAEATERKILRNVKHPGDAYMRSGDLLRRDADGYFYFVDRIGDTFRWKGENVSTQEVAEALAVFPGVETVNVYGVEVPGHEGRAGMAAIALKEGAEAPFDAQAFHELAATKLPPYAVPVFLRLQAESEVTTTFKLTKVKLRDEGYDPMATDDPIYIRDAEARTYVRLHDAATANVR